jgi:hypothetical protein
LREFVIAVHMRKESLVVCPAAAMHGDDAVAGEVGDVLRVHAEIEELVHSLVLFWEPTADLDEAERQGFADTVAAIRQRLARLTELEESALFPLCEAQVPADDQLDWAVAAGERCARAAGTRRNGTGDRCARAVAAGLTGSRAGGSIAVVGPGWSGTGAWTSYAPRAVGPPLATVRRFRQWPHPRRRRSPSVPPPSPMPPRSRAC